MRTPRNRASIQLQFDRIQPGVEIGPHAHGIETLVYLAAGEIVYEYGPDLSRRVTIHPGDVLYEAPDERHMVRNEGRIDALALLAAVEPLADLEEAGGPDERTPDERTGVPDAGDPAARAGAVDLRGTRRGGTQPLLTWDPQRGDPVRRSQTARVIETAGVRRRLLVEPGDFGTGLFTVAEVDLAPGAGTGWHRHLASEHVIVVMEGRGAVRVGDIDETLEPLKGIRVEMGLPHAITNTGRTRLRYFVCATPAADPLSDREDLGTPS